MKAAEGSLSPARDSAPASSLAFLPVGLQRLRELDRRDLRRRLARLNHVLIPASKLDRDRLRQRRSVKVLGVVFAATQALTREGRLLLLLLLPVSLAALDVRYSQVHLLWAMLWGLLISAWATRPLFNVRTLTARVNNARRVAVDQELNFEVELCNAGVRPLFNLRVLPPFLPWDGRWTTQPGGLPELLPGQKASVVARARFQARGEHQLDTFGAGRLVLGGLAVGRTTPSPGARFLVVPRIAQVVDVTLRVAHGGGSGSVATSVQPGETDIAGVRPYRVGDELKHLHARTWARTGIPHVRHYLDEREDSVTLAVLTGGPEISELVKEAAISLAAGAAARLALHKNGLDALVCDEAVFQVTPRAGPAALDRVLDQLAVLELSPVPTRLAPLREALSRASAAVIIAVEDNAELSLLVARTRARGVPCVAAVVVEGSAAAHRTRVTAVRADAIEQGRPIRL